MARCLVVCEADPVERNLKRRVSAHETRAVIWPHCDSNGDLDDGKGAEAYLEGPSWNDGCPGGQSGKAMLMCSCES